MEEREQAENEVQLPDERVEDLEPDTADSDDVGGAKHIGQPKYEDIKHSP